MKKSLVALALLGAFGAAHAQSSVVIYGTLDAGVTKTFGDTGSGLVPNNTTKVGKRDNNKLGFKGVEDLGNGVNALFQIEARYESDTGATETSRPLFQGQSRVGVQGAFGTVRLGRGLTAFQESITAFDPWNGIASAAGFISTLQVAGYTSTPYDAPGSSNNRFSNALFYNSPVFSGFQANVSVASKETSVAAFTAPRVPFSTSVTFNQGMFGALAAYERNATGTKLWSVAGSVAPIQDLKLTASFQRHDTQVGVDLNGDGFVTPATRTTASPDLPGSVRAKSFIVGANYIMGPGKLLVGYGQQRPVTGTNIKQVSVGYEYSLSKRTYVYADVSQKKIADSAEFVGVGVHHNF